MEKKGFLYPPPFSAVYSGLDGMTTYDRIMARKAIAEGREPPPHPRTLAGSGGSGGRRASCCCRGRSRRNPERSSRVGPAHTVRNGFAPAFFASVGAFFVCSTPDVPRRG